MGFEFTHRGGIERQVRSIAREQIDKALLECGQDGAEFGKLVHGLRRRCKKLRGLVRLIEPHFKQWKQENRAFGDAADVLSGTRDAAVQVETFAHVLAFDARRDSGARIDAEHGAALMQWLESGLGQAPAAAERARLLADFAALLKAAGETHQGLVALGAGLRSDRGWPRAHLSAHARWAGERRGRANG